MGKQPVKVTFSSLSCFNYIYLSLSYPTYECLSTLLGIILGSHLPYPFVPLKLLPVKELSFILHSPTALAPSLGVYSLRPDTSSLVSLISVPFRSSPSSAQSSDWFYKNISGHVLLLLKNPHCVLFPYPEAFKVDSKPLFSYSSHTYLLHETFALATLNKFLSIPSTFMPPCLECPVLYFSTERMYIHLISILLWSLHQFFLTDFLYVLG